MGENEVLHLLKPAAGMVFLRSLDEWRAGGAIELPDAHDDDIAGDRGDIIRISNTYGLAEIVAIGPGVWRGLYSLSGQTQPQPWRETFDARVGDRVVYRRAEAIRACEEPETILCARWVAIDVVLEGPVRAVLGGVESVP